MQVAILAGGLATRLRPLTNNIPKSMIDVNGKPFLQYQLEFLKKNGITDIVLCVGYLSDLIEDYFGDGAGFGVELTYSKETQSLLGTAGALKHAGPFLEDEFFIMYGDSYIFLNFNGAMSYFKQHDEPSLMVIYKNEDRYDRSNVATSNNKIAVYDKINKTNDMVFIDYGVCILKKQVLSLIPSIGPYSLESLFSVLIKQEKMLAYETFDRFYEIGSLTGLEEFRSYALSKSM